jgi:hypothetical protein
MFVPLPLTMPPALYDRLASLANARRLSLNVLINRIIENALDDDEDLACDARDVPDHPLRPRQDQLPAAPKPC